MSGTAESARITPSKPCSAARAASASGCVEGAFNRCGISRSVDSACWSPWRDRMLATSCLGVASSRVSMRCWRYGGAQSWVMKCG